MFSALLLAAALAPSPADLPDRFRVVSASLAVGAEPVGDAAFAALAAAGVRTVVSVDGKPPDAAAKKFALRVVHVPVGYDGVPADAALALTRVMREATSGESAGPVYVHCHHGKHRGPAAAAVCGMAAGELDRAAAVHLLEDAGTGRNYPGLWESVKTFAAPPPGTPLPELTERVEPAGLAAAMLRVDDLFDRLHAADTPADRTLLSEQFREAARLSATTDELRTALDAAAAEAATGRLDAVGESCVRCHAVWRDAP